MLIDGRRGAQTVYVITHAYVIANPEGVNPSAELLFNAAGQPTRPAGEGADAAVRQLFRAALPFFADFAGFPKAVINLRRDAISSVPSSRSSSR